MDASGERSALAVGIAGLAGAVVGAAAGGLAGAGIWAATHPNPEGLEGLAVVVVGMLSGALASYPGAVLGVWLAVRGRRRARATVLWTLALYPLVTVGPLLEVLGVRGPGGGLGTALAIPIGVAACAGARVLGTRERDAEEDGAR